MNAIATPNEADALRRSQTVYHLHSSDPPSDCACVLQCRKHRNTAKRQPIRDWTRLENHKCSHCPLKEAHSPVCPAADDLAEIIEHFSNSRSYDRVVVEVRRNDELHSKETDLQTALAYLFPAILAHSACPYASLILPWLRFGRVFPTMQDIYLMGVAFSALGDARGLLTGSKRTPRADEDPAYLLSVIFQSLLLRIRSVSTLDACANAIVKDIQWAHAVMRARQEPGEEIDVLFEIEQPRRPSPRKHLPRAPHQTRLTTATA